MPTPVWDSFHTLEAGAFGLKRSTEKENRWECWGTVGFRFQNYWRLENIKPFPAQTPLNVGCNSAIVLLNSQAPKEAGEIQRSKWKMDLRALSGATNLEGLCPWEKVRTRKYPSISRGRPPGSMSVEPRLWVGVRKSQSWSFLTMAYPHVILWLQCILLWYSKRVVGAQVILRPFLFGSSRDDRQAESRQYRSFIWLIGFLKKWICWIRYQEMLHTILVSKITFRNLKRSSPTLTFFNSCPFRCNAHP